jgi:hypothetical protein
MKGEAMLPKSSKLQDNSVKSKFLFMSILFIGYILHNHDLVPLYPNETIQTVNPHFTTEEINYNRPK